MIELQNIIKTYAKNENMFHALNNISFQVQRGDMFGIIGMSGAGKSTLLQIISGLIPATSGRILIDGEVFDYRNQKQLQELRNKIGFVFQGYHLLMQKNVYDNIAFPLRIQKIDEVEIKQRVIDLIKKVGLNGKEFEYPANLSGGQKQRVAIARALANQPKILLLDEPTSALDSLTTKEIIKLIKTIHEDQNITMILITHEIHVAKILTNRLMVIDQGKLIEIGKTSEMFSNPQGEITKLLLGKEVNP